MQSDRNKSPTRKTAASDSSHGHLWHLPDGTPLHAPMGMLTRHPDSGELCCHLCGRWFRALGSHVRAHGYSADQYRQAFGLCKTRPLAAPDLCEAISRRQHRAYWGSPEMRRRFEPGQALARSGQLAERARQAHDQIAPEGTAIRRRTLEAGRARRSAALESERNARLDSLGTSVLAEYLRQAYDSGASLDELARVTGLGRSRLGAAMAEAGIVIRPTGINTPEGKRSRARTADAVAAAKVGTDDLAGWLLERRRQGATLKDLAEVVGHSTHWVRWRLERNSA